MTDKAPVVGVILAGGLSRRMAGTEKSLLELAGKPLLAHVRDRLAPQVAGLVLNANGDPARYRGFGLPLQPDTIPGHAGPLAGILAGMQWARSRFPEARFIATAATDTPFFPRDCVARLCEAAGEAAGTIALATSGGRRHPVFGVWPVQLADDLGAFLASGQGGKVMAFVQRHRHVEVAFDSCAGDGIDPFFNVNTPDDLRDAAEALHAH